jgi:hypothetical protein
MNQFGNFWIHPRKSGRLWKVVIVVCVKVLSQHLPAGIECNTKNLSQDSRPLCHETNREPDGYKAATARLTVGLYCLMALAEPWCKMETYTPLWSKQNFRTAIFHPLYASM